MKKINLLLAFCSIFALANATVILDEPFDYPVATLLAAPDWVTSGTFVGTGRNLVSPALSYSNVGGKYILSDIGKSVFTDIQSASTYVQYKTITTMNSGVCYLSFLFKAGFTQARTGMEIFGLNQDSSDGPRIWVGKGVVDPSKFRFGVTRSGSNVSTVVWSIPEFEDINETFLLILKYDLSTKTATFYINPKIGDTEPVSAAALDATVGTARTYISRICFKTHNTAEYKSYMGGARLSTSWTDAVERAKLTVPIVESASGINSTGFTAHWTSVVNATGYKVVVYQDATIVETFDVSGQATESFEITGLNSETEYTYKVYAVDNSGLYSDSSMSAPSLPVTTGILSALNNITASKLIISGKSIITPEEGIIEVYNTQGLQVYKASHIRIVNTGLDTGLYIVKFTNYKGSQFNRKIRIQ